jgi:hypothetical protein
MKVLSNIVLPCKFRANKPAEFLLRISEFFNIGRKNLNRQFVSESVIPAVFVKYRLIN